MSAKKPVNILPQIALSLLTPPTMIMFMIGDETLQLLKDIGESTEEIFRGERLPILKQHELPNN